MNDYLTRQMDIIPMEVLDQPIQIIGAGAIGGWTTLALAKMGFGHLTVWDFDFVDSVNMGSQLYRIKDIGKPKVDALTQIVEEFTGLRIASNNRPYTSDKLNGIVITAVDSMAVRKQIFGTLRDWPLTRTIIDPRMGAEQALLYVIRPSLRGDCEAYEKSLYSDSESVQERCTAKATIYTANLLSGLVCKAVKDELTSQVPLRTAQWNIGANEFLGFNRKAC